MNEKKRATRRELAAQARQQKRERKRIERAQRYFNLPYGLWWFTDDGNLVPRI